MPLSTLIVSASEQFDTIVKRSLLPKSFSTVEFRKRGSSARRYLLERYYNLVIINAPLPDESGLELALDTAENSSVSVLLLVPKELYEETTDRAVGQGVLVLPKPFPKGGLDLSVRYLAAEQNRILLLKKKLESAEEKLEELRTVTKAKLLLMDKKKMTEDEAHRFIGKQAMDNGISRGRAAERILEDLE